MHSATLADETLSLTEESKRSHFLQFLKVLGAIVISLITVVILLICNVLLILTLYFSSGNFRGVNGWLLLELFSLLVIGVLVLVLGLIISRLKSKCVRIESDGEVPKQNLCSTKFKIFSVSFIAIALFILVEIVLWLVIPLESIFPLEPHNSDALSEQSAKFKPEGCDVASRFNETKTFFRNADVDFSNVKIVYGGAPGRYGTAAAMVLDENIYLTFNLCPSVALLVHEAVHLWQFQQGDVWFSPAASVFWSWLIEQRECSECLYDYGGLLGLRNANLSGYTIKDFGVEMQAEIVEDYYYYLVNGLQGNEEFPLLKKYALEILVT